MSSRRRGAPDDRRRRSRPARGEGDIPSLGDLCRSKRGGKAAKSSGERSGASASSPPGISVTEKPLINLDPAFAAPHTLPDPAEHESELPALTAGHQPEEPTAADTVPESAADQPAEAQPGSQVVQPPSEHEQPALSEAAPEEERSPDSGESHVAETVSSDDESCGASGGEDRESVGGEVRDIEIVQTAPGTMPSSAAVTVHTEERSAVPSEDMSIVSSSVLAAESIRKEYGGRVVVSGVSISVSQGEVIGLLGPNGAGKTTSFYMIVGLVRPDSGAVSIGGRDITSLPVWARAREGIGYLPQEASVFRELTVRENIDLVWQETGGSMKDTDELLERFGITHIAGTKGYALSGGERRRVEIARAMTLNPKFILLDEPFSGIDPIAVNDIRSMIRSLKEHGCGVLITDHNVRETLSITDRTYLIHDGMILMQGSPDEVAADEMARKFYLGEDFKF